MSLEFTSLLHSITIILLCASIVLMTLTIRSLMRRIDMFERILLMGKQNDFLEQIKAEREKHELQYKLFNSLWKKKDGEKIKEESLEEK